MIKHSLIVFLALMSYISYGQSQGVTNSQTKLRPNQLRWSPTDATLDSVYIIRADTSTGEPGWYLVTLSGGGGVQDTPLAGDVVGGLNSTFVRKINGVTVENITPQNREVLTYNGTQWTPDSIALEDLPQMNASRVLGRGSSSAGAVTQLTPSNGVKIIGNYIESDLTAGTGINISGTTTLTVSNSAPDQTVTISGATGTYPNFTVAPTAPGGSSSQVQYNNAGSFGAVDSLTVASNPDRLGVGVPVPTARLDIQGRGSTSATSSLIVQNSSAQKALEIKDNTTVDISDLTNPNTYVNINGTDKPDILKVRWGAGVSNYIGFGSNTANNPVINMGLAQISSHPGGYGLWVTPAQFGNNKSGTQFEIFSSLTGTQTGNCLILTSAARGSATHHNPTSGVYNMVMVGGAVSNQYMDWNPSSGTATFNSLSIKQQLNTSGSYSGIVRGLYYSPILTSVTGIIHRAIETETGDVLFNTTSGSTTIGTTTVNPNAKLEIVSTSKGFLPPRMTTEQRDAVTWVAGDEGMIIFNSTTKKHQGWDGTTWNDLY